MTCLESLLRKGKIRKYFLTIFFSLWVIVWIYLYSVVSKQFQVIENLKNGNQNIHKLNRKNKEDMKTDLIKDLKATVSAPNSRKVDVIMLKLWPTLDTREVQKRKMNFNSRQYPLEVDFSQLTKAVLNGKKIGNHRINPHPYRYVYTAADRCKKKKLSLVILTKSKASNFEMRNAIRKTWGHMTDSDITIVFMLGHIAGLEAKIRNESDSYTDIVQEDFIDSYKNNTLKTTMAFNWAAEFCPNADFILYVDDDVFVNLENVKKYIERKERRRGLLAGQLLRFSTPYRDEDSKWFVSWKEYPFDKYPPYLGGFFILTSQDVTSYFSIAIPYIKAIPIDDAYLGIVAAKLNIMPKSCPGLVRNMPGSVSHAAVTMNFKTVIGYHLITSPESLLATWNLYKHFKQPH
ncbi:beta-1,3-galactosyltransferase 5-like [Saccostrea echinata]|uniref:beta-1,3-galactosyltransferase 5-like n=1 Tax=Saccostrea echinata TaxID=191078 RepID=UPI002A8152AA|nr:beta-1,3-galactosyltransferase 5-like [Saccostrea echinata]